ncbi:AMP-binding protein [Deinococcus sp. QL22]|uniref:AMP-binding protein n=1 Tax=Deinococcus sp. QL22 TaxID=2939437 RepID=UPI0020180632|nr:AMP-binding protein [Deinococcus sp. QL22]UQN06383.1 AMP-binding protein [Deinococcus sp. QL22]
MTLVEVRAAVSALSQTGLLGVHPAQALAQLGAALVQYGPSLYTLAVWAARRQPDSVALVDDDGPTTCRALLARADAIAAQLAGRPERLQRVGLLCRNHLTFVATLLACGRLGLDAVLLNTTFSPEEVAAVCASQRLELLICDDAFAEALSLDSVILLPVSTLTGSAKHVPIRRQSGRGSISILTSGSTGTPKVVRRKANALALLPTVTALLQQLPLRAGAPTLLTLPLFHGHGLATLCISLLMGAPLYVFARSRPEDQWRCLEQEKIEVLVLVPTVLHRLLNLPNLSNLPTLRAIICGSAPLPERTQKVFGPVMYNLYGSSEAGLISLATPLHLLAAPGTVGRVLPGVTVQIERAQLRVRSTLTPRQTWFDTGDMGTIGAAGLLFLCGRSDDLLICGGENVYPEAIEARIACLPNVLECAVVGVPDAEYGQCLHAFIVLGSDTVERADLERDLARLLPRTLRPKQITFLPALPRNAVGKLMRARLPKS